MAVLTAAARKSLPMDAFAIPEKRAYPIHDKAHARDALARVSEFGTPSEQSRVRSAVHKRYPNMGSGDTDKDGM
jgi:hypothetical protein